jgi:hypothetical protein
MKFWKKIAGETIGAEIAEAAVVLPLVFMLILGIYWPPSRMRRARERGRQRRKRARPAEIQLSWKVR